MFRRILSRSSNLLIRHFSDDLPPKGFEKFFKSKQQPPKAPSSLKDLPRTNQVPESENKTPVSEEGKHEALKEEDKKSQGEAKPSSSSSSPGEETHKPSKSDSEESKSRNEKKDDSKKKKSSNDKKAWGFSNASSEPPQLNNLLIATAIVASFYYLSSDLSNVANEKLISYSAFITDLLPSGRVKYIVIKTSKQISKNNPVTVLAQDKNFETIGMIKVPDVSSFVNLLESQNIGPDGQPVFQIIFQEGKDGESENIYKGPSDFLPNLLVVLGAFYLFTQLKSKKGGSAGSSSPFKDIFGMGKSTFKIYGTDKKMDVSFKDVAGQGQAKREITEFVEFLKNPEKFKKLGARMPRGALLVGPPGTGKTLLAKASAGEAGVPFITTSGSEFVEMFVGVGASRVRDLFKQAREKAPSIIFIDEIDAVGRKRDDSRFRNDERDTTLNQLLVEMDGFQTDTYVVVMAATNRQDTLDAALLRPGRFDRIVEVTLPDIQGREEILKVHLKPLTLSPDFDINACARRVAALTPGFSGADLSQLCNEAAILAARDNKDSVERVDFEKASEKVMLGLESSKKLTPKEKKIVSYHEAGHAVAGWFLEGADPVIKVSVLPRSKGALGFAQNMPKETPLYTQKEFCDKICMILGGRVSELIFFGSVTNGASDDLKKATQLAQTLVETFGMGKKSGLVSYNLGERYYSETMKDMLETEVKAIIDECMERTMALLTEKKDLVINLAERLIEKEGVVHNDLVEILGKRPFEESEEYKTYVQEQNKID